VEYKVIYRSYSHTRLIGRQNVIRDQEGSKERADAQSLNETEDWSGSLNSSAKEGFTVKETGALPLGDSIVFWALLERP
jgi:hypothetical protein